MPARLSLSRRLSTAARWPLGVTLTSWRYMWRTTPMHRGEEPAPAKGHLPPAFPPGFHTDEVQTPADGVGPLFHRRYVVRFREAGLSVLQLMDRMRDDLDAFAPSEFATFRPTDAADSLTRNDEYVVRMPGPWDGPVRVVDVGEASFRLATLEGHLEAGQIEFTASAEGNENREICFTIESWARSGDRFSNLLYTRLRMAKEVQLHMWVSFLERVVEIAGGRRSGCIEITTRRVEEPCG